MASQLCKPALVKKIKKAKVICVTGTPCTGKTTIAYHIAQEHGFCYIDVKVVIAEYKLKEGYDRKNKCVIVDEHKLAKVLEKMLKQTRKEKLRVVVDSHLSQFISPKLVDLCLVTTCDLDELHKRLKKRKYSKAKIEGNQECEIMEVCKTEAEELGHTVVSVDTSTKA